MIDTQATKHVVITAPAAIYDNASLTTTELDTLGYRYCDIYVMLGATDIAMTALKVTESDTAGSGHADVTGLVYGATGYAALPTADDGGKIFAFHINLNGRKRYLDLTATAGNGTAGTYACAWAVLSRGEEAPGSAAERGLGAELTL